MFILQQHNTNTFILFPRVFITYFFLFLCRRSSSNPPPHPPHRCLRILLYNTIDRYTCWRMVLQLYIIQFFVCPGVYTALRRRNIMFLLQAPSSLTFTYIICTRVCVVGTMFVDSFILKRFKNEWHRFCSRANSQKQCCLYIRNPAEKLNAVVAVVLHIMITIIVYFSTYKFFFS